MATLKKHDPRSNVFEIIICAVYLQYGQTGEIYVQQFPGL